MAEHKDDDPCGALSGTHEQGCGRATTDASGSAHASAAQPWQHARPGRPRQLTDDARRDHLIDAAEALFLEEGFHAGTMNDIARRAGMSKKTLYQLYPSKQALFNELLERRLAVFSLPVEDDGADPETVLVELLLRMAQFMMSPKQVAMMRLMIAESPRSPEIGIALQRLGLGRGNGTLERWLAGPAAHGLLKVADGQEAAHMLFGCAIAEPLMKLLVHSEQAPDSAVIEARIRRTVRLFLREPSRQPALVP